MIECESNVPSTIYYECHVTVEPVNGERLERLHELSGRYDFKVAKLLMEKEPSQKDSFTSGRGAEFVDMHFRMRGLVRALKGAGFKVLRNKIEAVVLDERFGKEEAP